MTFAESYYKKLNEDITITKCITSIFLVAVVLSAFGMHKFWGIFISIISSDNSTVEDIQTSLTFFSLSLSLFVFTGSLVLASVFEVVRLYSYLTKEKLLYKEEKLKNISESINLFYMPLYDLLTYDKNIISRAKSKKLDKINCNRHLARPDTRSAFDRYVMGEDAESGLLDLVKGEIKSLQNEYIELKKELERE